MTAKSPAESWTDEQVSDLVELAKSGTSDSEIAEILGRSYASVRGKLNALGLTNIAKNKKGRMRPCMCCGGSFWSEGIHNRLCKPCKDQDSGPDARIFR